MKINLSILLMTLALPVFSQTPNEVVDPNENKVQKVIRSQGYFEEMTKVLQHPRCLNCHPAGNRPTQGMDMHVHQMNVQRGLKDDGNVGMKCMTCHHDENNEDAGVPGAPHWKLAPKSMAWQGLTKGELCRALKDKKKNHGMTLEKLIVHNGEDKLVGWGWNPGAGRVPVPGTQKEFGELTKRWVDSGAECPK